MYTVVFILKKAGKAYMKHKRSYKIFIILTIVMSLIACTPNNNDTTENKKLTINDIPTLLPDVLNLREKKYDDMPYFDTQEQLSEYALWNFLNGDLAFECRLSWNLSENLSVYALEQACSDAMSYYLFSSYKIWDLYTEDDGDPNSVYAKVKIVYDKPEYDEEARIAAYQFVVDNPVPEGGFTSFEEEKEYARKIHDYIAFKVTYDPMGYEIDIPTTQTRYEVFQEAYNVLGENQTTCICAGYARAFALVCQYAGINCAWVWGNENPVSSHAWNIIYPCDGSEPVLVDVTWDDTMSHDVVGQTEVYYSYFYIPLSIENEHVANEEMGRFIQYLNKAN